VVEGRYRGLLGTEVLNFLKMTQKFVSRIENSPFQGYKVVELQKLAREQNVKYYYKLRKGELIVALTNLNISVN